MRLDHFGVIAPYYDRFAGNNAPVRLIELAKLPYPGALLDAGGGTGRLARALGGLVQSAVVVDESEKMLVEAAGKPGLLLARAQTETLPFPADNFDRIIMIDALHHVANQQQTADELWRVLKPGGRLVIEEPDISKFAVRLVALFEKLALMRTRIISAERISALFSGKKNPPALVRIEREGHTTWVVVDKVQA